MSRFRPLPDMVLEASWLTADRALAWCRILAGAVAMIGVGWIALSHHRLDLTGKPLGTDFLSFWAASKLALSGHPGLAYDMPSHAAAQRAAFGGAETGYFAFFYPPLFLLICWPLALLPYGAALTAWLGVTGIAYWQVIRQFLGTARHATLAILAFPAVLLTLGHGQNAFLSTALFGGAILALGRRSVLAGILLGALAYKPHLGLLIPVCLLTAGAWTTILAAGGTVLALGLASILAFGTGIWPAFFAASTQARATLEQDLVGAEKMQSVFAAVQLWHGPLWLAYGAQLATTCAVAAVVVGTARARAEIAGAALVTATLLASPFLLDYDLTLLAIPLAVVFAAALRTGFWPFEKIVLFAGFVLPLVSRTLAMRLGLPLAPVVIAALLAVVVRRAVADAPEAGEARRLPV